ncbi:MAG TPA: hypothetical protein VK633_07625, partial [Verrucomicrobiae bacterium]|nr:hypothetical protein [Verrucomicrobiae bacterium]
MFAGRQRSGIYNLRDIPWMVVYNTPKHQAMFKRFIPAVLAPCLIGSSVCAKDQPQWGEAWSRNIVSSEKGLPDNFDPKTGANIKWSADLGTETHST